jgi:hypothetical protein
MEFTLLAGPNFLIQESLQPEIRESPIESDTVGEMCVDAG